MKNYSIIASQLTAICTSNSNVWTLAENDLDQVDSTSFTLEVETEALDFDPIRLNLMCADSEPISQVSPDYKPYMEEGCEVAFLSVSATTADRDRVLSTMKNELSDFKYFLTADSGNYIVFATGTSNATETQFYKPALSTNVDVTILTLWD